MSRECGACPPLQAENSMLRRQVEQLQRDLFELRGQVNATVQFIDREDEEPTMPRRRLVTATRTRLAFILDSEGRR